MPRISAPPLTSSQIKVMRSVAAYYCQYLIHGIYYIVLFRYSIPPTLFQARVIPQVHPGSTFGLDMSNSRSRPASTSSSLLQDVPGAYPADNKSLNDLPEYRSLSQAVHARRAEYTRSTKIKIKVGTWNSAGYKGKDTEQDVGKWFVDGKGVAEALSGLDILSPAEPGGSTDDRETVESQEARFGPKQSTLPKGDPGFLPGGEKIGLYLLGLQEVVNISSATEALRPYSDPEVALKFKRNIETALPIGYRLVAEQQLIGLLLLAYAAPNVATDIKSVSTTSVGTGLMGYMGNKGAVTARLVIGSTLR